MTKKRKTPEQKLLRRLRIKNRFKGRLHGDGMLAAFWYLYRIDCDTNRWNDVFIDQPALAAEYESFRAQQAEVEGTQTLQRVKLRKQAESLVKAKKQEELNEITLALKTARRFGTAVVYLASLPTDLRDKLGSREEKQSVAAMRKASINSNKARELLGCSITELNRWTEQGLTPILYTIASNYDIQRRYWAAETMTFAKDNMASWRAEHEALKTENRRVGIAQNRTTRQAASDLAQQITDEIRHRSSRR